MNGRLSEPAISDTSLLAAGLFINRAENSHRPTKVPERRMGRFKSAGQAQRFLCAFEPIREHFHSHQHKLPATEYRATMSQRLASWRELTGLNAAA